MILDGKNLEVASVPLNRLVEPVFTEEAAYTQQAEDNNRMAAIEDLSLSGDKELKNFIMIRWLIWLPISQPIQTLLLI